MYRATRDVCAALLACCLIFGASGARACDTPVFRYALENWTPSAYEMVVFHRGPLGAAEKALVKHIQGVSESERTAVNVVVTTADVAGRMRAPIAALWKRQKGAQLPWLVARYPAESGIPVDAWSGRLTSEAVSGLLDSPKRREMLRRMEKGDAVIYLLLESGDAKKDQAALAALNAHLQWVRKQTVAAGTDEAEGASGEDEAKAIPITFSVVRVRRTDPAEAALVRILTSVDREFASSREPIAYPLFGQGRILCGIIGDEITTSNLEDAFAFLTGECSCEVKGQNPGVDLLMAADWGAVLEGRPEGSRPLPSLASLPPVAAPTSAPAPAAKAAPAMPGGRSPASLKAVSAARKRQIADTAKANASKPGAAKPAATAAGAGAAKPGAAAAKPGATAAQAVAAKPGAVPSPAGAGAEKPGAVASPAAGTTVPPAAAASPSAEPTSEESAPAQEPGPAGSSRLLAASAGIAVLLGLVIAAVVPRFLLRKPRRPA